MSEKRLDTLYELLEKYQVEVPIVQRDYVQGGQDENALLVRLNLLKDMKAAILGETPPLDLNFVYGKANDGVFIPIDGQQRLTTLFLLHLYAFRDDIAKSAFLDRFTYETRITSRECLKVLTKNRAAVFKPGVKPSLEIEDSEWFISDWIHDPTIQSVLVMLDLMQETFCDIENLGDKLTDMEAKPIVFQFLEMQDLGMEDGLYIKLNARGKPLTEFENFKARLIGRMKRMNLPHLVNFELSFDGIWTDLFWKKQKNNFDQAFYSFFGVLLMNQEIIQEDKNWANTLDYSKINSEIFERAFYTLNFLCQSPESPEASRQIFDALDNRTFVNRVLFHGVTTYLFMAKGKVDDADSMKQWLRVIKNLAMNTQIDSKERYRSAVEGINDFKENWNNILSYMVTGQHFFGFNGEQIEEEKTKAKIILKDKAFADEIYKAEEHPFFSGKICCALYYAQNVSGDYDKTMFVHYWDKISALFYRDGSKYGNLLRRAMLTFGDYTLSVGPYKTLCVDDPNESSSTPSLKRLFSSNINIMRTFLDAINVNENIKSQLMEIIDHSTVSTNSWRYCFIKIPQLFELMSSAHLRLRQVNSEMVIVSNKSSNGYNYDVFLSALYFTLKKKGIPLSTDDFQGYLGTDVDRYLIVKGMKIRYENRSFTVWDKHGNEVHKTTTDDPLEEEIEYLMTL